MGHRFIGNKEVLKENINRLINKSKDPDDKEKNREILKEIRKDQELNGKYYSKESDDKYNPFKDFFKK